MHAVVEKRGAAMLFGVTRLAGRNNAQEVSEIKRTSKCSEPGSLLVVTLIECFYIYSSVLEVWLIQENLEHLLCPPHHEPWANRRGVVQARVAGRKLV